MTDFEKQFEKNCKLHDEWIKKYEDILKNKPAMSWFKSWDNEE